MSTLTKITLTFIILIAPVQIARAAQLQPEQLGRVKTAQDLIQEADRESLQQVIEKLQKSPTLDGNIYILESVAKTYNDLKAKYAINTPVAKERLLEKIRLNMAYFQLGGQDNEEDDQDPLDIMIRRKLREHLPEYVWKDASLFHSLE